MSIAGFERTVLSKQAWGRPGSASSAARLFTWQSLGRLLAGEPAPDVLVVARGTLVDDAAVPRSLVALKALMQRGMGICARRSERCDAWLAELAQSLREDLRGDVHAQLFATPAGTYGFSWHYDFEDVFIVQTAGVKDYFFRPNTVDARAPIGTNPDFTRVRAETSPLQTAHLLAGDCLYIPARWWHYARCVEDSLSISLGVQRAETLHDRDAG